LLNIKIGKKLLLALGAIFLVMGILAAIAITDMSALHEDFVRKVLVNNKRQTIVNGMTTIVREEAIAVRNCFLQKERTEEMIKRINDGNAKFDEALEQVERMTSRDNAKGRENLLLVKKSWTESRALNERTLALLNAGRQLEAFALYEKESRAAERRVIEATEDLVKYEQTQSEVRYDEARYYRDTRLYKISLGFVALLLAIIIVTLL